MQFTLSSTLVTLAIIANLAAPSAAFVMDTYSSSDCSSDYLQRFDVSDSSCSLDLFGFSSFKLIAEGGLDQKGYFFEDGTCEYPGNAIESGFIDIGGWYHLNECNGLGKIAIAASSALSEE
ncbi:hypothetical protein BHYA_0046g00310 [Botrytis hyacinthi]|uniref:Ecp2 effector protein domain-containing protein n=1 Tax=Botrytis hyacinthi TaxID=278943 RepID=A0A4Z1H3K3_9HELO|nr:hypothetical protein BHYA_0046g00310 [Botrytis hyacinthi]